MRTRRWSLRAYRALQLLYPREFRARFGEDLERDFLELLRTRGAARAWSHTLGDLVRALPLTHADARAERRRLVRVGGPLPPGRPTAGSLVVDIRHAWRGLLKAPVFSTITAITLALGIGANSAIFSLVNAVMLRPMGYERPERLMLIHEAIPQSNVPRFGVSPPDYLDLTQYQQSFSHIGILRTRSFELAGTSDPEQVDAAQVSGSIFALLGVNPALGRVITPEDEQQDRRVVVLSDALWQRRFGGRIDLIGERLMLDRQPYTVVGVMPRGFEFPKRGPYINGEPADLWVPLVFNPFERQARGMFFNHTVVGRLREGGTIEQAAADIAALAPRVRENYPPALRNSPFTLEIQATPLAEEVSGQVRRPLLVLLGAVGLVLLVACANVANLILSRAVTRQREIGVRAALGAGRQRLFQMLVVESLLLALVGGALGLAVGYWVVRAMPAVIATSLPGVADVTLDARVVAFTSALSVFTALFFGLVPLVGGGRRDLVDLLREGGARAIGGPREHRVQGALVVTSVAFAFVLLVGAGLLIRSFTALTAVEHGMRAERVLTMRVSLPREAYRDAGRIRGFYRTLHEQLQAIPSVRVASISSDLPVKGDGERRAFTPERTSDAGGLPPSIAVTWIHGSYFQTFGIPIVRGRAFLPEEEAENRFVAIVSRGVANRFWPGEDAIGKRIRWGTANATAPWMTVVGIAGDVVDGPLGRDPALHAYVPYTEISDRAIAAPTEGLTRQMTIAVHGDGAVESATVPVRAAVAALDPMLAVTDVTTMARVVSEASAPQRFSATVLSAFATGAMLLAAIGLYGVLAFGVSQRTREIGVRLALGAPRSEVQRLVIREGMRLTMWGLVIGGMGAAAASRLLEALLFEIKVYDFWTFAGVPALLTAVALAACWLPARRASRVDPMVALRSE
jgi:putative ABC transport system permease protein